MAYDKKRATKGQRFGFPAGFYNDLQLVVKWFKSSKAQVLLGRSSRGFPVSATEVTIKNESGGAVTRFAVLEVTGSFNGKGDFANRYPLRGNVPSTPPDTRLAIVQSGGRDDATLPAVIAGVSIVKLIRRGGEVAHGFADAMAGVTEFVESKASTGAFEIIASHDVGAYAGPGAGAGDREDLALVRFPVGSKEGGGGGSVIPVKMTRVNINVSQEGTAAAKATYEYQIVDAVDNSTVYYAAQDPADHLYERPLGQITAATFGLMYNGDAGPDLATNQMIWCNEQPDFRLGTDL